jgi:uncharacterized protein YndB with AHSA1/START domain
MIKTIVIAVIVLIVIGVGVVLGLAAMKPDTFRVQRAMAIKAPPEKIFALINDFHAWGQWSPWEKKDPAMRRTFSGAPNGKGAAYAWEGDKNVGQGSMEIVESAPPSRIAIKLDFMKPFEAHNTVVFALEPKGDATNVTWDMQGPTPFFAKIIHVFLDMDKMVGNDFETGLANLKAASEK